jgi:hypothetical protein
MLQARRGDVDDTLQGKNIHLQNYVVHSSDLTNLIFYLQLEQNPCSSAYPVIL